MKVRRQNEEAERVEQARNLANNGQYDDASSLSKESDAFNKKNMQKVAMNQHLVERNARPQPVSTGGGFGLTLTATQHGNTPEQIPQSYEEERRQSKKEEDEQEYASQHDQSFDEMNLEDNEEEMVRKAEEKIVQICRYSHKILRKYVVNGMIQVSDGPEFHTMVNNRDYRILCIMEVYSQNKNEDDFLANLGLLSQVIRQEREEIPAQDMEASVDNEAVGNDESMSTGDDGPVEEKVPEPPQEDSIVIEINKAKGMGKISQDVASFAIDAWKAKEAASRKLKLSYNVYKMSKDIEDFSNSLNMVM